MGWLLLVFVIGPLVELYVLVQVAGAIGVLPALASLALVSIVGAMLVKRQGVAAIGRVRAALEAGQVPNDELADGFLLLVAGALLIVPGFVTDVIGLLLLVPPIRALVRRLETRRWRRAPRRVQVTRIDRLRVVEEVIDVDEVGRSAPRAGRPPGELEP